MHRYFIEVAYKGTNYKGFQIQKNAPSVQAEVQNALAILFKQTFELTGSSRTDAGVHAVQNYFHFDSDIEVTDKHVYNLNSILPADVVVKAIFRVNNEAHCRFDATSREYEYRIYAKKDPFLYDRAYYYPYKINIDLLQQAAEIVMQYNDFTSFSKRNTQVKTFICNVSISEWHSRENVLAYSVKSNRFLRGMVKGLVGTMLKVGRELISLDDFKTILEAKDCTKADFSAPSHGLFLIAVNYSKKALKYDE